MNPEPTFAWDDLPAVTGDLPGCGGRVREAPEDFLVREIPSYEPQGSGSHLFLHVRKRGLTTRDVVKALGEADVPEARIGVAGLKDKYAVTEQWLSIPWSHADAADRLEALEGVEVLQRVRHKNKLGMGHLRGNRFEVRIREVEEGGADAARRALARLREGGVPNYYGPQRFGRFGRNAVDGLSLARGEPVTGDRRLRRFFLSALQSWVFNRVLAQRVREGLFRTVTVGDWARKHDTGGTFLVESDDEGARAERFEISATAPLHGRRVPISDGRPGEMERAALDALGLGWPALAQRRGDRRLTRLRLDDAEVEAEGDDLWLRFTLPKGAYATVVLRETMKAPVDAPSPREERA